MRVEQRLQIPAPRKDIWPAVSDPRRYHEFMAGLVVAEVVGDKPTGCGSRWSMRLQVGSAPLGGTVEVVEFDEPADMAWNGVTGLGIRGRWRLRERTPGRTDVTLRMAYQSPGGLIGVVADRFASPTVNRLLKETLHRLRDVVAAA